MSEHKYTTDVQLVDPDEPVFVLRGKDVHARAALLAYLDDLPGDVTEDLFVEQIARIVDHFDDFANEHPDLMGEPD